MKKIYKIALYLLVVLLATPEVVNAQTAIRQTNLNTSRYFHRQTIIYLRTNPATNLDTYYDSMGRVALPFNDTFAITIAPGTVLYPSAKFITIIDERAPQKDPQLVHSQYDPKSEISATLGYYLGIASSKK